jgi:hypothetical protein
MLSRVRTERLAIDAAVLALVGAALWGIGVIVARPLLLAAIDASGLPQIAVSHPTDLLAEQARIAVGFALVAPLTFVIDVAYRVPARRAPHPALLAVSLVVLVAAAMIGVVVMTRVVASWVAEAPSALPVTMTVEGLGVSDTVIAWPLRAALLLAVAAAAIGRRAADR